MKVAILVLLGFGFAGLAARADCELSDSAKKNYSDLHVETCSQPLSSYCVVGKLRSGGRIREALGDEACDYPSYATCTYRSATFTMRSFFPCAVRPSPDCAPIFNIYSRASSEGLSSCQE